MGLLCTSLLWVWLSSIPCLTYWYQKLRWWCNYFPKLIWFLLPAGSKSRHSMFSDTSDLDPHHPARTNFTMPRENMSGDSRVWLLHHHPISALAGINSALSETDTVTPDKADGECKSDMYNCSQRNFGTCVWGLSGFQNSLAAPRSFCKECHQSLGSCWHDATIAIDIVEV